MSILGFLANKLNKFPKIKKKLKILFYYFGDLFSDKKTEPSTIKCISNIKYEHLFGYYDKSPWNSSGNQIVYLRVSNARHNSASSKTAYIVLKDLLENKEKIIGKTNSWNTQQGCMLQWLGPDYTSKIIYNDFRNNQLCSVILDIKSRKEKVISKPIYSLSSKGSYGLTLDFLRLQTLRPGYGYINLPDKYEKVKNPNSPCIWKINLDSGDVVPLLTYNDLIEIKPKKNMRDAYHWVDHIMINPNGKRFIFLHRWIKNGIKFDRLISSDMDGEDLYILLDDNMVSHCNWKDDETIITWANTKEYGNHYYLLIDKSENKEVFGEKILDVDGHPSFSPNGEYMITDTYPNFRLKQRLILYNLEKNEIQIIASVYANLKYMNETRCDLHPRWKRDSSEICFDGSQGEYRQIYTLNISDTNQK